MPCGSCGGTRQWAVASARRFDIQGVRQAARQGAAIAYDKYVRRMDSAAVDAKYGYGSPPAIQARPYKRPEPPERSS